MKFKKLFKTWDYWTGFIILSVLLIIFAGGTILEESFFERFISFMAFLMCEIILYKGVLQ